MEAKLLMGNEACVEGALAAGVSFYAGYPITPSNEIGEIMSRRLPERGGKFIQMEDEIASMGAIIGGSIAGLKSMTATSGPGFSLMQENLGFASMVEAPCVIVNVMRGGPSTGMPTLPSQGDVMQARWGTHGDHPIIALCPTSVREVFDLTVVSVNLSEKFRTPVILLIDEVIGHLREKVVLPRVEALDIINRKKPTCPPEWHRPYEDNKLGVPPMASFGDGYRYHVTGLTHDEMGFPTTHKAEVDALMQRLFRKIRQGFKEIMFYDSFLMEDATTAIVAYGSVSRSAKAAVLQLRQEGKRVGMITLKTLWPFPRRAIEDMSSAVKEIFVAEMNMGQIYREVLRVNSGSRVIRKITKVDGTLISPKEIIAGIKREGLSDAQQY